ncbi:MAG TPA: pantetheine-phosphate adenylyltransferase [Ktedonobacterales bacterium]|nr:pantetheine-phosphate adenylyltransferase [Ktedonobacterales bacterium]
MQQPGRTALTNPHDATSRQPQEEQLRLIAVYPGSFDPVHRGHVDIAKRAARLVDVLIIAVYSKPTKNLLFSVEERVQLWHEAIESEGLTNVRVERFDGLVVEFARMVGAKAIVRGLRAVTDFELEFQQALMNRKQAPEIETLMIVTALSYLFVSATLLKEIARLGGDLDGIVTQNVARALHDKFAQEQA